MYIKPMAEEVDENAKKIAEHLIKEIPGQEISRNEIRQMFRLPHVRGNIILEMLERNYGFTKRGRSTLVVAESLVSQPLEDSSSSK